MAICGAHLWQFGFSGKQGCKRGLCTGAATPWAVALLYRYITPRVLGPGGWMGRARGASSHQPSALQRAYGTSRELRPEGEGAPALARAEPVARVAFRNPRGLKPAARLGNPQCPVAAGLAALDLPYGLSPRSEILDHASITPGVGQSPTYLDALALPYRYLEGTRTLTATVRYAGRWAFLWQASQRKTKPSGRIGLTWW